MDYYVYITNDCNLKCKYCSVLVSCEENNIPLRPEYSMDELVYFIKQTQKKYDDNKINIYFFGGEPTLEYLKLSEMITHMRKSLTGYNLRFVLHTNGLLLDSIPDDILGNLSLIVWSLNYEMVPQHHLKDSYFSKVIENVIAVQEKQDLQLTARLTVTEKTSLYTSVLIVHNFASAVYWQIENCDSFEEWKSFKKTYAFEVELTFKYWLENLRNGRLLKLIPFMAVLKFMFFHDRDDNRFCCGYGWSQMFIQTDGECYACCDSVPKGTHHIGNIADGITWQGHKLTDYCCKDCEYRAICMGRCGRMHKEFSKEHIAEYCDMNRGMFALFLNMREELAEILRKYPEYEAQLSGWLLDAFEYTA